MAYSPYNPDAKKYRIKNLLIHGNRRRAWQFGYPKLNKDTDDWESDGVVEMLDFVSREDAAMMKSYLGNGFDWNSGHNFGNPAFCMYLEIDDFFRKGDGTIGITVTQAYLNQFPYKKKYGNKQITGTSSDECYSDDVANAHPHSGGVPWSLGPWASDYPMIGLDGRPISPYGSPGSWDRGPRDQALWTLPFTISAALYVGSRKLAGPSVLFKRNGYYEGGTNGTWPDGCADPNNYPRMGGRMNKPITLSGQLTRSEVTSDVPIILLIYNNSNCFCGQANRNRPVFAANISTYIPKVEPYLWRRFGTSAAERAIAEAQFGDPDRADGKWHLVRPYNIRRSSGWDSIEGDIE